MQKRLLLVCYEYPPLGGGGAVWVQNFIQEIQNTYNKNKVKIKIDILTYGNKKFENQSIINIENDIIIYRLGRFLLRNDKNTTSLFNLLLFPLFAIIWGIYLCFKNKYDLIYSIFVVPSGVAGLVLSKLFNIPHYLTIIGGDIYKPTKYYSPHKFFILKKTIALIINNSKKVNAISEDVKNKTINFYNINKKIDVNNLGLPLNKFNINKQLLSNNLHKESKSIKLKRDNTIFNFVTIGRLESRKAIDLQIKAFLNFKDKNIFLNIVGDGPDKQYLQDLITEYKLNKQIKLLGFISDEQKFEVLKNSDAFILSSYHEGFGLVILEAMSYGLPVIVTKCGGVLDIIKNNKNGIIVNTGDIKSLSLGIKKMINKRNFFRKIGRKNISKVWKYDISVVTKKYLKFLNLI